MPTASTAPGCCWKASIWSEGCPALFGAADQLAEALPTSPWRPMPAMGLPCPACSQAAEKALKAVLLAIDPPAPGGCRAARPPGVQHTGCLVTSSISKTELAQSRKQGPHLRPFAYALSSLVRIAAGATAIAGTAAGASAVGGAAATARAGSDRSCGLGGGGGAGAGHGFLLRVWMAGEGIPLP